MSSRFGRKIRNNESIEAQTSITTTYSVVMDNWNGGKLHPAEQTFEFLSYSCFPIALGNRIEST
jgi:hypothetical protein